MIDMPSYLTKEEALKRLNSEKNGAVFSKNSAKVEKLHKGGKGRQKNLTTEERADLAIRARLGEKTPEISAHQRSNLRNGRTSQKGLGNSELQDEIEKKARGK